VPTPPDDDLHGCYQCGSPVLWCVTTNGKRIAIDLAPNQAEGTYCKLKLEWDGEQWNKIVAYVPQDERPYVKFHLFTCHWDTCGARKPADART